MPVLYKIENDILNIIQIGSYTSDDFQRAWQSAVADPDFKPPMKVLMDGRLAQVSPPTREIEDRADFLARMKDHFTPQWAYVADPNSLIYGLARMASAFMESNGIEMEVFTDHRRAFDWLSNRPRTHFGN